MDIIQLNGGKIIAANWSLLDIVKQHGLYAFYDEEDDVFFLSIGESREALTEPFHDDVMIRIDPDTMEIVGLTIVAFQKHFLEENRFMHKLFTTIMEQSPDITTKPIPLKEIAKQLAGSLLMEVGARR